MQELHSYQVGEIYQLSNGYKWICTSIKVKVRKSISVEGYEVDDVYSIGYGVTTEPNNDFPDGINQTLKLGSNEDVFYISKDGFLCSDDLSEKGLLSGNKSEIIDVSKAIAVNLAAMKCKYYSDVFANPKNTNNRNTVFVGGVYEYLTNNDYTDKNYFLLVRDERVGAGLHTYGYRLDNETGFATKMDLTLNTVEEYTCIGVLKPEWWLALWEFSMYGSNEIYIGTDLTTVMKPLPEEEQNKWASIEEESPWYEIKFGISPEGSGKDISNVFQLDSKDKESGE